MSEKEVKGYECKHAFYVKAQDGSNDDLLCIKEHEHYTDGTWAPKVRFIENYKRDFYLTKEGHRNHKDKTEWEQKSKLQKFTTTQSNLTQAIGRAMGRPGMKGSLRMLSRNQYLYGTDITTPVLAKREYMDRYPDLNTENAVAVLDIETDVLKGHEHPISISLTFKDRCFLTVTKDFLGLKFGTGAEEQIQKAFQKYLGKFKEERGIELEVLVADTAGEMIRETLQRAHKWMPDFIAIWNINFDLPKIFRALDAENIDPAEVFCHPKLPPKYRHCRYIEGASSKLTASGKYMSLHHADRWHIMDCPASFYFIDAMCVYKRIRIAKGNLPSYSLDAVLGQDLNLGKLRFEEAEHVTGLEWHKVMQADYKIEYLVYNLFDCISMELLDEKNKDLATTISVLCEHSEYSKFPSNPRRLCDDLHFYCLKRDLVIASTSDQMEDELDSKIVSMKNWIVTLPTHLVDPTTGLKLFEDLPDLVSLIRKDVLDLDVSAGYPTEEEVLNLSKETTYRELSRIKGVSEFHQRRAGINLTAARTNAVEICNTVLNAPSFSDLLGEFQTETA